MIKLDFRKCQNLLLSLYCRLVVGLLCALVVLVVVSLLYLSSGLFTRQEVQLTLQLPSDGDSSDYQAAITTAERNLGASGYMVDKSAAWQLQKMVADDQQLAGRQTLWLTASSELAAADVARLAAAAKLRTSFSLHFLRNDDSRAPTQAGIKGALLGSLLTILVTALFAVPVGCATAIYLAEFAPRGKIKTLLELSINNLAAVPSVVFGLLGYVLLIEILRLPRASALVAGLVLGIMILPIIIVSAKLALNKVPTSLREAALSLGATPMTTVFHHIIPAALPGIVNGISMALIRAIGETAPLLVIGAAGFLASSPTSFTSASTALPVQIFTWAVSPEPAFLQLAAGAVLVLLIVSVTIHLLAVLIKLKFTRR